MNETPRSHWYQFTMREILGLPTCVAVTLGAALKLDAGCASLWMAMIACVAFFVGPCLAVGLHSLPKPTLAVGGAARPRAAAMAAANVARALSDIS